MMRKIRKQRKNEWCDTTSQGIIENYTFWKLFQSKTVCRINDNYLKR